MDKLSSILPSSPRVQSVDMTDAHPVRPGTPTFGRPVGATPIKDRLSVSQEAKDIAFKETLAGMNPKDAHSTKMIDDMAKKFFDKKIEEPAHPAAEEGEEGIAERATPSRPEIAEEVHARFEKGAPSFNKAGPAPGSHVRIEA